MPSNSWKFFFAFFLVALLLFSGCVGQAEPELKKQVLSKKVVEFRELKLAQSSGGNVQNSLNEKSSKFVKEVLEQDFVPSKFDEKIEENRTIDSSGGVTEIEQPETGVSEKQYPETESPSIPLNESQGIESGSNSNSIPSNETVSANLSEISGLFSDLSGLNAEKPFPIKSIGEPNGIFEQFYPLDIFPPLLFSGFDSSNPVQVYDAVSADCNKVKHVEKMPLFDEPQKINAYVLFEDQTILFGIFVDPSNNENPIVVSDTPFDSPSLNVYSKAETISEIFNSGNPLPLLASAFARDEIVLEGGDAATSIKLFLAKNGLQSLAESRGIVSESDCDKIKKQWIDLKNQLDSMNCDEIAKKLEAAKNHQINLEKALSDAEANLAKAEKELKQAQSDYQNLLKMGLEGDNYKFSEPSDSKNWNYVFYERHGVKIWFNGNGQKLIDFFKNFEKEIKAWREKIEKAIAKKNVLQNSKNGISSELDSVKSEIAELQKQLEDCAKKNSELAELEKLSEKCLGRLKAQSLVKEQADEIAKTDVKTQFEHYQAGRLIRMFPEFDRQILEKQKDSNAISDCDKVNEKQDAARNALSDAEKIRLNALNKYTESKQAYDSGDLAKSEELLAESRKLYEDAEKAAIEAREKAENAIAEKQDCLQGIAEREKAEELRKQEWDDWQKTIDEKNIEEGKPFVLKKEAAMIGLYGVTTDLVYQEIAEGRGCDCPMKALIAANRVLGKVFPQLIKKLGIGVMKAPIDALSPGGLAGKAAQKIASHALSFLGSDSLSDFAKDAIIKELVKGILPKTDIPLIDKPAGKGAVAGVKETLSEILSRNEIETWTFENTGTVNSRLCGPYDCDVKVVVFYNPKTRHVLSMIKGSCCPDVIMISYKLSEEGVIQEPVDSKVLK